MANYFDTGEFPLKLENEGFRRGRSIKDGYARGWGLEYGELRRDLLEDPIYREAVALAEGRSIQSEPCRMNLFLLAKYFLPKLLEQSGSGSIFEFGSYRGGSAIFLAAVCRSLDLKAKVYGLDTFEGMPPVDKSVDAHNAGDFAGADLAELREFVARRGLNNWLEFVQGSFEETAPAALAGAAPVLLAHIDCDIRPSVAYAYEAIKPWMVPGGYVVFDDAHTSSCLGATEAVEDLVIRRDGLNCEQIWPHFVFRIWPPEARADSAAEARHEPVLLEQRLKVQRLEGQLAFASQNLAHLQERYEKHLRDLGEAGARIEQTLRELDDLKAAHADLGRAHWLLQERHDQCLNDLGETNLLLETTQRRLVETEAALGGLNEAHDRLKRQVNMARASRWVKLGRWFRVGPGFDPQ